MELAGSETIIGVKNPRSQEQEQRKSSLGQFAEVMHEQNKHLQQVIYCFSPTHLVHRLLYTVSTTEQEPVDLYT